MKGKKFKQIDNKILSLIPSRKIGKTKAFAESNSLKETAYNNIVETVSKENKNYFINQGNESKFCYISHQKKDGIISAKSLYNALCEKNDYMIIYNPQVDEKSLASYIKFSQLESKAIECGHIEKIKMPLVHILSMIISGILTILSLILTFLEITTYIDNNILAKIFNDLNFHILLPLFIAIVFIVLLYFFIYQKQQNKKKQRIQLNKTLAEMNNDEFTEFIDKFSEDDFLIPSCNENNSVFICVFQNYSFKEKYILKSYWNSSSLKQIWWIFIENTNENEKLVLPESRKYKRGFYCQKPLAKDEKKRLAKQSYFEKTNISPIDDPGINLFGADYLCRFYLNEREPLSQSKHLNEKIDKFCNAYNSSYQTDIRFMIRIIAELSCTYGFDFTNRRNWEYLFDYNQGDSELNDLDKQITDELCFDNKTFKKLIPEIINEFSEDLEDIVAEHSNKNEQASEYEQWCIVKALKRKLFDNNECYFAICDTLMAEFASCKNPLEEKDISSSHIWRNIIIKTAETFYKKDFFWFLPTLIHNLIYFFDTQLETGQKIFSRPIILEIARTNLLLNINFESEQYCNVQIDLIRDHYNIVCNASLEQNSNVKLDANSSVPPSFELLQFSNIERRRYYNALCALREKETAIIEFFNYLFDMFCIIISMQGSNVKFCYNVIYKNPLYDKYMKKTTIASPTIEDYIKEISSQILDLLSSNFKNKSNCINESINELKLCLNDNNTSKESLNNILCLIVEFDMLGFNTLNFISCLLGRIHMSKEISQDIYLHLGTYLLGIIFLAYHETSKSSFYNEDFKYLVKICTNYIEPGGAVLGFMNYCHTIAMPLPSANQIERYITPNKTILTNNLKEIASNINYDDIEDFLTFINTIKITDKEICEICQILELHIKTNYATQAYSYLYLEYISLQLNHESIPAFQNDTPQNNIEKIIKLSANTVYLIYDKYIEYYETKYIPLCNLVAPKILKSSFVNRIILILHCLDFNLSSSNSNEYLKTMQLIFEYLDSHSLECSVHKLLLCSMYIQRWLENPQWYSWTTEEKIQKLVTKEVLRAAEITEIQAKEFCALRKWNYYGIAIYLRGLLISSLHAHHFSDDFTELNEAKKTEYIIEHFSEIQHTITIEGKTYINSLYVYMLTEIINNNNNIQQKLNENECMNKLINTLLDVVKTHQLLSDTSKESINKLLSEYMHHMNSI